MSSIARRATPTQAKIMRAVRGAVRNAANDHKDWKIDRRFEHSIAKRAAGTLTANWPDASAGNRRKGADRSPLQPATPIVGDAATARGDAGRRARQTGPSPLDLIADSVGRQAGDARRRGDVPVLDALVGVLRDIAKLRAEAMLRGGRW